MKSTKIKKKFNLSIRRYYYDENLHPAYPERVVVSRTITNIQFVYLADAINFGNRLAQAMANPKDPDDAYFLKRGFEETLPHGQAYETGFKNYSMCITPIKY